MAAAALSAINSTLQEIATLAGCRSPFITRYHASLIPPGSSQLLIVMELLLGSVADAVSGGMLLLLLLSLFKHLSKYYEF